MSPNHIPPASTPMPCTITPAQPADLDAMVHLLGILFAIEQDFHPNPERQAHALKLILQDPQHCALLVARDPTPPASPTILGMINLQLVISTAQGTPSVWVEDLVVDPRYQHRGIGKALLAAAEAWARSHHATRLQLLVDTDNTPALNFYDHLTWKSTHLQARMKMLPPLPPLTPPAP